MSQSTEPVFTFTTGWCSLCNRGRHEGPQDHAATVKALEECRASNRALEKQVETLAKERDGLRKMLEAERARLKIAIDGLGRLRDEFGTASK